MKKLEHLRDIINNYDLIITIDSPDFNYPLVKEIKKNKYQNNVIHIVAPTVWAWREYRAKNFAKIYNELLVKPKNQTINWGIDIDFTYFRKLSVVEFIKTVVLMLVFAYFIKSLLDVIVAITTRK